MYQKRVLYAMLHRCNHNIIKQYEDKAPHEWASTTEMSLDYRLRKKLFDCIVISVEMLFKYNRPRGAEIAL